MSCTKHSRGDSPIKRVFLGKLRAVNDSYIAEMKAARRRAEKRRAHRLKKAQAWLKAQDAPDAFQRVGRGSAKVRIVKRPASATIASISVENRSSWSGRATVSLPRLSCLETKP